MVNSEFKAAVRTFYREKSYAVINLSGLSLAIACCLILGLYLRSELTYDQHHLRYKQIFRAVNEFTASGSTEAFAPTSFSLGPLLKENYPEVKDYVRFRQASEQRQKLLIRVEDMALYWDNVYFADDNVFDIFTHKIVYGDPKTALKDPASAAVSETFAKRYFGDINPIGKTIQADIAPQTPRKITLVFRDLPENTHLKYDALFHETTNLGAINPRDMLLNIGWLTYLLMPENYRVADFNAISKSFYTRFMEDRARPAKITWNCWLQPLADIHLHSENLAYDLPVGNKYYVYGFIAVAAFILLVASINYVNLAIARSTKRAREIGMRKILGVPRFRLMFRFLGEAVLFSLVAMIIGTALVELALKLTPINSLLGKPLALRFVNDLTLPLWLLGLSLFVGLLSGLYPAVYLSSISPLSALANSYGGGGRGGFRLRELLVLLQFTVSVVVIACTLIMAMQMRYIAQKPLGFETHDRVIINMRGFDVIEKYPVIKNDLMKDSRILGVTASSGIVGTGTGIPINAMPVDNNSNVPETFGFYHMDVADNFLDVMGIKMASGRDFSQKLLTDVGNSLIVNEAMVKNRGWQNPFGKRFQGGLGGKVIGVVKDFHFKSLYSTVTPFLMRQLNDNFQNLPAEIRQRVQLQRILIVKISGKDVQQTLRFLQEKFSGYDPKHPFEYEFLDDSINKLYISEEHLMKMTGVFSGICIFISCLGLFGLAAFTTQQRSKEIGIRRVLGASASQIIVMLSSKTLWLVLAGSIVASIIAYFAIDEWLSGFAYKVRIHPLVFVLSAALVIVVAFVTIALQSYKTAQMNPARTLRYE